MNKRAIQIAVQSIINIKNMNRLKFLKNFWSAKERINNYPQKKLCIQMK